MEDLHVPSKNEQGYNGKKLEILQIFLSQTLLYALFGSNHLTLIDLSCILSTETLTIAFV